MKQDTPAGAAESLRLFYALWPDDGTRAGLMRIQAQMRGRMVRYENLHITLAFLGQQPANLLPVLTEILPQLPALPITLTLDRLGYFTRKRIAWVGMHDPPEELFKLQRHLAEMLAGRDISFDNRPDFKPHVTLARDARAPTDMVFAPITWRASQAVLVQSMTNGGTYRVLASRSLDQEMRTSNELGGDTLDTGL